METQVKADLAQEFEVAFWDYSNAVVLAMRELLHADYRLSPDELRIADGLSLNFRLIRPMTWTKFPLAARQDISKARNHREAVRRRMKQN